MPFSRLWAHRWKCRLEPHQTCSWSCQCDHLVGDMVWRRVSRLTPTEVWCACQPVGRFMQRAPHVVPTARPLCDIPSGCCFFTGPWTVTRSSLCMLRRVAAFCRPLRPVLLLVSMPRLPSPVVGALGLLVSFPRSRSPVVGVLGLCWMWHGVPFACQRRPVVGTLKVCWLLWGSFDCFCCPHTPPSTGRP